MNMEMCSYTVRWSSLYPLRTAVCCVASEAEAELSTNKTYIHHIFSEVYQDCQGIKTSRGIKSLPDKQAQYAIDPDGADGVDYFSVTCDFDTNEKHAITVVRLLCDFIMHYLFLKFSTYVKVKQSSSLLPFLKYFLG